MALWDTPFLFNNAKEAEPPIPNTGALTSLPNLYARGQVCYADGHVEFQAKVVSEHFVAELAAGHNPPRPMPPAAGR